MSDITYYLFGNEVCRMYGDGYLLEEIAESIKYGDGAIYQHSESDHSTKLIDALDGWYAAAVITREEFIKLVSLTVDKTC